MSSHNIGFYEELTKIVLQLSLNIYRLLNVYRKYSAQVHMARNAQACG